MYHVAWLLWLLLVRKKLFRVAILCLARPLQAQRLHSITQEVSADLLHRGGASAVASIYYCSKESSKVSREVCIQGTPSS